MKTPIAHVWHTDCGEIVGSGKGPSIGSLTSRLAAIALVNTTATPTDTPISSIIDFTPVGSPAILLVSAGALRVAVAAITPEDAFGWFAHAGYSLLAEGSPKLL